MKPQHESNPPNGKKVPQVCDDWTAYPTREFKKEKGENSSVSRTLRIHV